MHGHRLDAELAARAQNAQGDFAAIRDDDLVEHGTARRYSMMNNG
jgi:hypothetical protein